LPSGEKPRRCTAAGLSSFLETPTFCLFTTLQSYSILARRRVELYGGIGARDPRSRGARDTGVRSTGARAIFLTGKTLRPPHQPPGEPGTGPAVSFARSGLVVPWRETFRSILEQAEASDVPVQWSCRTGVCHTCETAVIAGSVRYVLQPLEPPAEGNALICCSVPEADVALDL
jgi:ferredoxin